MSEEEYEIIHIISNYIMYCRGYETKKFTQKELNEALGKVGPLLEKQQNKIASLEKQIKLMQNCDLGKTIKKQQEEKKAFKELEDFIDDNEIQNISVFTAEKIKNIIEKQQKQLMKMNMEK